VLGNDAMAMGFMRTLQSHEIRRPRDVSVVSFDDIPSASMYFPGLTTVRQEMSEIGEAACHFVLRSVEAKTTSGSTHVYPMTLVVRESTGKPPD
jgi:DNA-binding LacI/PurR family transcriptional regulator